MAQYFWTADGLPTGDWGDLDNWTIVAAGGASITVRAIRDETLDATAVRVGAISRDSPTWALGAAVWSPASPAGTVEVAARVAHKDNPDTREVSVSLGDVSGVPSYSARMMFGSGDVTLIRQPTADLRDNATLGTISPSLTNEELWWVRLRYDPSNGAVKLKTWQTTEPGWQVEVTDTTYDAEALYPNVGVFRVDNLALVSAIGYATDGDTAPLEAVGGDPDTEGALLGPNGRPLRGPSGGLLRLAGA